MQKKIILQRKAIRNGMNAWHINPYSAKEYPGPIPYNYDSSFLVSAIKRQHFLDRFIFDVDTS
jgi:hypothetical protein